MFIYKGGHIMTDDTNLGYYYCIDCEDVGKHKTDPNMETCERCGSKFCISFPKGFTLNLQELTTLGRISRDKAFWKAMIDLKEKDIIEFNLKMSQFRMEADSQEQRQDTRPKCPTCGSPNIVKIDALERVGSVAVFGLFSKKINKTFKCKNCGHTW